MPFSTAERSFLYESLKQTPPMRPDGRSASQFRPMEAELDVVSGSNGSAKITLSDGSECLVSIKVAVVETRSTDELIEVDVEINTHKDDSSLTLTIKSILKSLYLQNIDPSRLKLTEKFSYKLFIDVLVLANYSYPLTLASHTAFMAISNTYLPKLTSSVDDKEIEEQAQFDELELVKLHLDLPIIFTFALFESNFLVDPNSQETEVCDNGLIVSYFEDKVIAPLSNIKLNDNNLKSINPSIIVKTAALVSEIGPKVSQSLRSV
jgi:exosome complex component RRP42